MGSRSRRKFVKLNEFCSHSILIVGYQTLEVLTSDELVSCEKGIELQKTNDKSFTRSPYLSRVEVEVMPEVGCGLDNLDTMKKITNITFGSLEVLHSFDTFPLDGLLVLSQTKEVGSSSQHRGEKLYNINFEYVSLPEKFLTENEDDTRSSCTRLRLNFLFNPLRNSITNQINLVKERRVCDKTTRGTIADGGGLDARTVTQLIGNAKFDAKDLEDCCIVSNEGDCPIKFILPESFTISVYGSKGDGNDTDCIQLIIAHEEYSSSGSRTLIYQVKFNQGQMIEHELTTEPNLSHDLSV